jgi:O-antigen/teichoic acid export membrane protein
MTLIETAGKLLPPHFVARLTPVFDRLETLASATDETSAAQRMAMIAFAIRICSAAIAFVSQIILARLMGDFEYGIFVFVWVIAIILGNLSCLGFHTAVIRFLPQYRTAGADEAVRGLAITARIFAMLSATLIAGTGIAALHFLGDRIESHYVQPLFVGAFVLPMIALGDVLDGTARANGWPVHALSPTYIVRPLLILAFVAGAIWLGRMADANTAIIAALAATYVTTLTQFAVVTTRLRRRYPAKRIEIHFRTWLMVAFPIFLIEGFYFMLTNADVIIVGIYLPPEKVAVYFAAAKTMALVHFVYFAVKAAAAQRFSALVSDPDRSALASFAQQTVRWTFWPSLAVGGLVIAAGPFLLSLFGPGFQQGHMIMVILFVGIIAKAMIGPGEVLLTMAGELRICATPSMPAPSLPIWLSMSC